MIKEFKDKIMYTRFLQFLWGSMLLLGWGNIAQAQVRPVTATMVFTPPYTLLLSDYTSITSQKLRINLQLNDLSSPPRLVKLRFTIQGAGITVRTRESFLQSNQIQPINLTAGIPQQLSGLNETLRQYFNPANLEVLGIDRNQFVRSKRLPSGIYRWQVEVLDFRRSIPLNNLQLSSQTVWMVLNQPPLVNIPQNNQKLRATTYGTQNVIFQWLNRSASSPNSAFTIQYNVFLYEIYEPNGPMADPMSAPRNLVYQNPTPLTNTTLIYNNTFPPLTPGKRYIFQVQAQDVLNRDLFENNGFSQVVVFQYGDECVQPTRLKASVLNTQNIKLNWDANAFHTGYRIRFREAGSDDPWDEVSSQFNDYTLSSLKPDTEYEYAVSSICGLQDARNWVSGTAKTNAPNAQDFVCGVPKGTYDISNETPLDILNEEEEFMAGGYTVKVRRATGSNGQFSGVGITAIPVGRIKVKFKVGFKEVFINNEKRMLRGNIYVVRNKWQAMALAKQQTVDEWQVTQEGKIQIKKDGSWTTFVPPDGQDYMLTDAKTNKKVFVDRNGKPDIPLEDRDYSNYTTEQIIAEIKKLKEEADDAIADGRWGDALKLLDKAAELAEVIGDKVKKVVGFSKVVLAVLNDMIKQDQAKKDALLSNMQDELNKLKQVSENLNQKIEQTPPSNIDTDHGVSIVVVEEEEISPELLNKLKNNGLYKPLFEASEKVNNKRNLVKPIALGLALLDYYKKPQNLEELTNRLKQDAKELFEKYKTLKDKYKKIKNKDTRAEKIKNEMGSDIQQKVLVIRTEILQNIQEKK